MTPRERVMAVLRGEGADRTPFTTYDEMVTMCAVERELRGRGMCLVDRIRSYTSHTPNVTYDQVHFKDEGGRGLVREVLSTPHGELSTVWQPAGFTSWRHEYYFKAPDDYRALLFLIEDTVVGPDYEAAARTVAELGDDYVVRDNFPLEPLQNLISSSYMSMEDFCIQWMENRDEILKLYEAFVEVARRIYPIVANGPLEFCNYGGNVVPQVIGREVFREHYVPHYDEAAEALHRTGKLIGTHLDADNRLIMDLVAQTDLDYIEAYDAGISPPVREARAAWPDKVLWLNYPCAWHLRPEDGVREGTVRLIEEADGGLIIGITDDVPTDRWRGNFTAIMDGIDEMAAGGGRRGAGATEE
jgi:hypothetical protein